MKRTLLFGLLLAASAFSNQAFAQSDVTLNVRLHPIQTIVVKPAQNVVNLDYVTTTDYASGVTLDQNDHISIYSTGAFAVKVKSSTPTLESTHSGVSANINSSDLKITPSLGTGNQITGSVLNTVSLSTTPQVLISNTVGGIDKNFNISYAAAGAGSYVNKYFNVESPTVYTTTVTYTIEAQ